MTTAAASKMEDRLGRQVRSGLMRELKKSMTGTDSAVVAQLLKVPTREINALRQSLKGMDSSFIVVKNSLARLTFKDVGWQDLEKALQGTCGVSPIRGDMGSICKLLSQFSKDHEGFVLQGGILQGKWLTAQDLSTLAKLPSRDLLLSRLGRLAQLPLARLAAAAQGPLRSLAAVLSGLAQKKSTTPPQTLAGSPSILAKNLGGEKETPKP